MDKLQGQIEEALDKTADKMGEVQDNTIYQIKVIIKEVLGEMGKMLNKVRHNVNNRIDNQAEGKINDEMEIYNIDIYK